MISQKDMQTSLDDISASHNMIAALDRLYDFSLEVGYLTKEKLEGNRHFSYFDDQTALSFKTQINVARSQYTPTPLSNENMPKLHCPICFENVGLPGKENLRVFEFDLSEKRFFAQLTPFPLFPKHFVLISKAIKPMIMSEASVVDMVNFEKRAPGYTVLSNSDVKWAGSSILSHHHYQAVWGLNLPVMQASFISEYAVEGEHLSWGLLNFPICTIFVKSFHCSMLTQTAGRLIRLWRSIRHNNTCNLCFYRLAGEYRLYIILRNPDFRTPKRLMHIKKEGVGVVEVCGEGIYPVPKDRKVLEYIETHGLAVIKGIIEGNNPVKAEDLGELFDKMYDAVMKK